MSEVARSVIIHGHFYQPPREDPWFDVVEREPSAAPFHDWNERIERECYRAVVAARVLGPDGRIACVRNTLASISFDVGPTLFEWLEREARPTYDAIIEADRLSRSRADGHGNAMAMPYHHIILPLATRRDKVTEVRWGIADFRRRFGREPEGLWLPETAVDDETLDIVAAEGIRFTVLAPHQVEKAPADGSPGTYRTGGGRQIAIFVYHGAISHDVAFGGLLQDAHAWAARLAGSDPGGATRALTSVATDGETYGHHHRFAEMALAAVLGELQRRGDVRVENFASFLARHPAREPVTVVSPTSWSCAHGVGRWNTDCGCRMASHTQQRWRAPLREGLDWLAGRLHAAFEQEGWELLGDPWAVRDGYGAVMSAGCDAIARHVADQLTQRGLWSEQRAIRARELLEMERDALRMFTSCGWFFDDPAGIETLQVLRYAAHAIELTKSSGVLEAGLLEWLAHAASNDPAQGNGRELYRRLVHHPIPAPARAAAGFAAMRRLDPEATVVPRNFFARMEQDQVQLTHCRTGREYRFRVTLERAEGPGITAVVSRTDGEGEVRVALADFPERTAVLVRAALRRRLVERWLPSEAQARVAAGDGDLMRVASGELERAVKALAEDPAGQSERVIGLTDLVELLGQGPPFDAQTLFYRIRESADPARAQALEPVARRLGFV
jgi:alpha-amylase/alpha-mannosidase (GH57 family)